MPREMQKRAKAYVIVGLCIGFAFSILPSLVTLRLLAVPNEHGSITDADMDLQSIAWISFFLIGVPGFLTFLGGLYLAVRNRGSDTE